MKSLLSGAVTLACLSLSVVARAQTLPQPIVIDVQNAGTSEPEAIRAEVARELNAPVFSSSQLVSSSPRGTLVIFVTADNRLTVLWRTSDGSEVQRSVNAPSDPVEFARTVALLAANLANDQIGELLGQTTATSAASASAAAPTGPITVNVTMSVQPPTQAAAPPARPPSVQLPQAVVMPMRLAPPMQRAAVDDWRGQRARQTMSFGIDGYMSWETGSYRLSGRESDCWFALYSQGGLFFNRHVKPWLRLGVNQVLLSSDGAGQWALNAAPYGEVVWNPWRVLELYGQVGVGMQVQFGATEDFGMNASATGGLRFRIGDAFSIGLGARTSVVFAGPFNYGYNGTVFPGRTVAGAGIELGWTLGG